MKIPAIRIILPLLAIFCTVDIQSQVQYMGHIAHLKRAEALAKEYPSLCSVRTLVKTGGNKDILVLTIGTGEKDMKPGIAIIGGTEGNYIAGREISLGFAENLLKDSKDSEVKKLLESITFYIFPDISPDASDQYFAALKYERVTNSRQTDNDRDFESDEDTYEDLNGDGYITLIRVSDPAGNYLESVDDKKIMVPADLSRGEKGSYFVFSEGIDNDQDGKYNEDDKGGVNANRNFTYNYEEYGLNSGYHAMSEPETKAVADFLFDHFNIYMTVAFGPQDNLGQPMKASEKQPEIMLREPGSGRGSGMSRGSSRESADRRITSITKKDEIINKLVSEKYHEITGAKGNPQRVQSPGNFMDWAYFHYGRYSFSTPGWWYPEEKGKNSEIAFLSYAEKNKISDVYIPWTEIKHPDFPGKKTEVGGIKPFVMINPPSDTLGALIKSHYKFITAIAEMHPELEFLDKKIEDAGDDIYRVNIKVHNKGLFATMAEVGVLNQWTRLMRIVIEPGKGQTIVSGQKIQRISRLEGGGSDEFSWLISGKGKLSITAGAVNTGIINTTLELK
ncbi:MAG TPA: M14 family metallopeptidase [Bacteroidales bacterium]|nr:M14 family metallopeptidase [Bacteroidales bacterium]